jgi:glutamine synthetase
MIREELIMICTCEIAGQVRGKAFPARELPMRLARGVGWTPTNIMITTFGVIGDTPFGALGDLMLLPDPAAEVRVDFGDGGAPEHFFLGDICNTDGTPWDCCPRFFLRRALGALESAAGLKLFAAFEQEFIYTGVEARPGASYSLDAFRRQGVFGEVFTAALRQAGVEPDSFLPEYGSRQFEVTTEPAIGVTAADQAVITREIARATAQRLGQRTIFSPIVDPDGVGSGVHVHMSFRDATGRPAIYDPKGDYGLTPTAQQFMAGVLHHLPAIAAVSAPSLVSYIRLTPNRWAPTFANLGERDREAALRICPVFVVPGADPARQYNVEFRTADAAASPYLQLGAIVHAGVDGIRKQLKLPRPGGRHVAAMSEAERKAAGIRPLPRSLAEALDALEATPEARDWFGPVFLDAYLRHKRFEIRLLKDLDPKALCERYAEAY